MATEKLEQQADGIVTWPVAGTGPGQPQPCSIELCKSCAFYPNRNTADIQDLCASPSVQRAHVKLYSGVRKSGCESEPLRERHRPIKPSERWKAQVPDRCCSCVCCTFHPDCIWKSGELCIRCLRNESCFFSWKQIINSELGSKSLWKVFVFARNVYKLFAICRVFRNFLLRQFTAKLVGEGSHTVASVLPD